jgi:hypothetical protein
MQSPSEENEEDDKSGRGEEFDEPTDNDARLQ